MSLSIDVRNIKIKMFLLDLLLQNYIYVALNRKHPQGQLLFIMQKHISIANFHAVFFTSALSTILEPALVDKYLGSVDLVVTV